jgi:lipopolysaccharide transport system permease protein
MSNLPLTVYTPDSPLRNPGRLIREMFSDLLASRELAWRLFVRDTSAQYRKSILGYIWAFLPPLVTSLPFIFLNSQGVVSMGETPIPYAAYAMVGTIIWQVFVDALNSPLRTVSAAKPMLARINFPREAILLSGLGQVLLNFLIRLVLLVGVFLWYEISLPAMAMLSLVGIVALIVVGFVLGIMLTPIGILFSDVQQALPVFTLFLLFITPVLYAPPTSGVAARVAALNPLTPLVLATRDWLTLGTTVHVLPFLIVSTVALILLFLGWLIYRLALPHLIVRIGN